MRGSQGNVVGSDAAAKLSLPAAIKNFQRLAGLAAEPQHVRNTVSVLHAFLWQQGITEPWQVTTEAVEDYLGRLHESGRAPKTLINHCSSLSSFCDFLIRRKLLTENPCLAVQLRRPEETLPRYLDDAEITQTLQLAREHGIWPEVCLALSTGLRASEMIRLCWPDINFERRCLTVRKSKTHRPRVIPLSRPALVALRLQRRITARFAHIFPARRTWTGCCRYVNRPRAINWWMRALRPIQEAVPKFGLLPPGSTGRGWHLLRHTFASRLAQAGVSLYKIAQWLGHSDIRTTRIYAHLQVGFDPEIEAAGPQKARHV